MTRTAHTWRADGARIHGPNRVAILLLLAAILVPGPRVSASFDPASQSSVAVYLRLPDRITAQVRLEIDRFEFDTADGTIGVAPTRRVIDSGSDAGRSFQWARAVIEPAAVDSFRVVLASARVRVGEIWTEVDLSGEVVGFDLRRDLRPGECLVMNFAFDPDATAVDAETWRPVLRRTHPERPPLGQRIFVAQSGAGTIAVVDRRGGDVVEEIGVGGRPVDLAWSVVERRLYVAVAERDEIVAIDLGDIDRIRRLPLGFGDEPSRVLLSADERVLHVIARGHDSLVQVSAQTFQETARIRLEPRPVDLVEDPRSGRIFVTSEASRSVEVIDPAAGAVTARFTTRNVPGEIEFLGDVSELLVASREGSSLERIDAGTGASIDSIELCGTVQGLAYQDRSQRVFAAMDLCREVAVLRPVLDLEIGTVALGGDPGLIRLDPEQRMLLVPLPAENAIVLVNTSRAREVQSFDVGPGPVSVVVP